MLACPADFNKALIIVQWRTHVTVPLKTHAALRGAQHAILPSPGQQNPCHVTSVFHGRSQIMVNGESACDIVAIHIHSHKAQPTGIPKHMHTNNAHAPEGLDSEA